MDEQQQGQGGGGQLATVARDLLQSGPETVIGLLTALFSQMSQAGIDPQEVVSEALSGGGGQQAAPGAAPAAGGGGAEADMTQAIERELAAAGGGSRGRITRR